MAEISRLIGDTSAIVAAIKGNEKHHAWAKKNFLESTQPIITCESVISESLFLLRQRRDVQQDLLVLVTSGIIRIDFSLSEEIEQVKALIKKYEEVPMSLADACLVRMSELHAKSVIFTLDADFKIYRRHRNRLIPLIMPPII